MNTTKEKTKIEELSFSNIMGVLGEFYDSVEKGIKALGQKIGQGGKRSIIFEFPIDVQAMCYLYEIKIDENGISEIRSSFQEIKKVKDLPLGKIVDLYENLLQYWLGESDKF